jgi:putative serine protease PepD
MADAEPSGEPAAHDGVRRGWLWVGLALGALVAGAAGGAIVAASDRDDTTTVAGAAATCRATSIATQGLPSVVKISIQGARAGGTGSGEIIRRDGYILTNNHVISAAANGGSISVLFSDGTSTDAQLVGRDPQTDLAVVKVQGDQSLPVITFGDSARLRTGDDVFALGAPLGFPNTVTRGIVSALERTVEVPSDGTSTALLVAAVQTDAAINPGNSGGALVDCATRLVGVPTAGAVVPSESGGSVGNIGIGFAIPSNLAKSVSDEIIASGHVTHSSFGIQVAPLVPAAPGERGTTHGVFVTGVVPGGPSDQAGLQAGDIITGIDGKLVTGAEDVQAVTLTKKPGDKVEVAYERNGARQTTTVTLGTASTG